MARMLALFNCHKFKLPLTALNYGGERGMDEIHPVFHTSCAYGVKKVSGKLFHVTRRAKYMDVYCKTFSRRIFIRIILILTPSGLA